MTTLEGKLLQALKAVVADILEYEKTNNLAPNPGREYCWDSVAQAVAIITEVEEAKLRRQVRIYLALTYTRFVLEEAIKK